MWWKWVIFLFVFFVIPMALNFLRKFALIGEKKTEEQIKHSKFVWINLVVFYWLFDLFYMSFIIDSAACKYIFGGLIMIVVFCNLASVVINQTNGQKNGFIKFCIIQDFFVGVGVSVYLIYIIKDIILQGIIIAVVAALYGGLFTLVGVAWTIRKGDKDRQEEERKKNVPYVALVQKTLSSGEKLSAYCINIEKGKANSGVYYRFSPFTIKNISNNHIFLVGIKINEKINYNSNKKLIEKGVALNVKLSHPLHIDCELNNVNLIIEDILGNKYFIQCIFGRHSYAEKWDSAPHNDTDFYEEQFRCEMQSVELPILQKE